MDRHDCTKTNGCRVCDPARRRLFCLSYTKPAALHWRGGRGGVPSTRNSPARTSRICNLCNLQAPPRSDPIDVIDGGVQRNRPRWREENDGVLSRFTVQPAHPNKWVQGLRPYPPEAPFSDLKPQKRPPVLRGQSLSSWRCLMLGRGMAVGREKILYSIQFVKTGKSESVQLLI